MIEIYQDNPFKEWRNAIKDVKTLTRIDARIDRMKFGNFGDHKYIDNGIFELRLDFGPGYRVYYAYMNKEIILLLAGGGKKSQKRDIKMAKQRWQEYKQLIK